MKKKIKIKGLPKVQFGNVPPVVLTPQQQQQWYKNQNMFGTPPAGPTPTAFNNPFSVNQPGFITSGTKNPNPTKSLSPSGMGPITADDYYANLAEQNTAAPAGTRFDANAAYAPGTPMPSDLDTGNWATIKGGLGSTNSNNPFSMLGPMLMGELAFVNSAISKIDQRGAERKFKDQFLSDNMYLSRPESISGNRGDYDINTGMFRPDEYVYGKFNKIAQMGGEMKRKVKITGLPEAQYGGTQDRDAVNQLYGNSAYMMNMFSQRQEQEPMQEYNETLQPDPRSLSVIEAEKGETLVKTGENSTIPEFYKIGGKRHYEGGTPLGPDKATPNSFIYSDTKAMKIKDPELLASFGLKAKKGGYTPAEISKKFNLNDKNLREGLYDNQDMLRKKTAIMNADKYISNLGKLALVQESKKGFPQGIPDIANPYMEKIGLDPMSFMPDQSQQNMMDNYGNLPMAQKGQEISPDLKPFLDKNIITWDKNLGKYRVAVPDSLSYDELQSLTNALNRSRYQNVVQSSAEKSGSKYKNFYAGLTPQDFEYKIVAENMGKEEADKLSEVDLRRKAYDIIGFKTEKDISNPEIYNDPEFFKQFASAFYKKLPDEKYRRQMGDDERFGFETYDAFKKTQFRPQENASVPRDLEQTVNLPATQPSKKAPIGLYPQDIVNTVGALQNLYGINKYMPRQVQFTPEYIEPTYYDPTREIAANAEMANIAAQNLAQFTGPQAFNARYSDVQGKGLANAANIMGRYNNLNVGVANQFEMANKQLANEANFKNALFADDFYTKTAIANQQYDNARTQGREAVQQNIVGAMDNLFNTRLLNELYPQYYISPSSLSVQYDPQAALKLRPKTQTGDIDKQLENFFPGFDKFGESEKNALRSIILKKYVGDNSDDSKDIFASSAIRSKRK
jgi:hypothetical protein